ncbi:LysR substrate-binding domain-containing protein [Pseudomonas sp. JDS28PS106]|uniref:LysR substrate-binding domain-containing protein n=1 Tax=Pseudomonas sp. JDS28PS106 TaxID=2497235 RepID=UPI002FD6AEC2
MSNSLDFIARTYPDIHLSVLHGSDTSPSLDALRRETADILIVPASLGAGQFVEHHRWSDHYTLVTARSRSAMPRSLGELSQTTRYVAWRHAGLDHLHVQLHASQMRFSHRGELSCIDTLLDLVGKGHCMSIVPASLLPGHFRDIEQVPLPFNVPRQISVIARPTSLLSNAASVVIQALKKPPLRAVQSL